MGLNHQGDQYEANLYPYVAGSLLGSVWGFDGSHGEFLAPYIPSTATSYVNCQLNIVYNGKDSAGNAVSLPRQLDSSGRCVKQDPMQSGAGDQAAGYRFTTYSDFSAAEIQRNFEGSPPSSPYQPDGKIFADSAFPSGYKRWNTSTLGWVPVVLATQSYGIFGLNMNLPVAKQVPVDTIVISFSNAAGNASMIYPPISYVGNLIQNIDPTSASDLASINPANGAYKWYCQDSGCDYSARMTYTNGTVRYVLLKGGFRSWYQPTAAVAVSATDPTSDSSFINWAINVPNDNGGLTKIELLSTPTVWTGLPATPAVLATRVL